MAQNTQVDRGIVEQAALLADIDGCLSRAQAGGGQVLALRGDRGTGKSRLLAAATDRAESAGYITLRARANYLESAAPFGVVRQLFQPYLAGLEPRRRGRLLSGYAAPAADLLHPGEPNGAGTPSPGGFGLLNGLFWLTANLAASQPLVLVVDDAHLADAMSLSFLDYLVDRFDNRPITVLIAGPRWTPELATTSPTLQLTSHPRALEMEIPPLGAHGVSEIVRRREWYPEADVHLCSRFTHASRGNPLRLLQLLTTLACQRLEPADLDEAELTAIAAEAWADGLARQLHLFPPPEVVLAEAVAALGDRSRLDWAGEVAGLDNAAAETAATTLAIAGIVDLSGPLRMADPQIGSAIYGSMSTLRRGALHAATARLLHRIGLGTDPTAHHLLLGSAGGEPWAVDTLRQAARRSTERGDLEQAASLLARALDEPPTRDQRAGVLVELAQIQTMLCHPGASEAFEAAIELIDDPVERARTLRRLGGLRFVRGDHRAAAAAFEEGLSLLDGSQPELALQLEQILETTRRFYLRKGSAGPDGPTATGRAARIDGSDLSGGDQFQMAQMAFDRAMTPGWTAEEAATMAVAALGGDPGAPEVAEVDDLAFYLAVKALVYSDRLDDADAAVSRAMADPRGAQSTLLNVRNAHLRASINFRRGRIPETMVYATKSFEAADTGWLVVIPSAAAYLACCHLERGETKLASAALELPGGEERWSRSGPFDFYLYAQAQVLAAKSQYADALDSLIQCGQLAGRMNPGKVSSNPWRSAAAVMAHQLGDDTQARRWVGEELELARAFGARRAIGVALLAAAELEEGRSRLDLLTDAVDVLRTSPGQLELARALVRLGSEMDEQTGTEAGWPAWQEGFELAYQCGASWLAKVARSRLSKAGTSIRRPVQLGLDALSPGERRVAELASQGMTNKDISEMLVVTRKAVEWHLNRAFKKLGISARQELATALEPDGPADPG